MIAEKPGISLFVHTIESSSRAKTRTIGGQARSVADPVSSQHHTSSHYKDNSESDSSPSVNMDLSVQIAVLCSIKSMQVHLRYMKCPCVKIGKSNKVCTSKMQIKYRVCPNARKGIRVSTDDALEIVAPQN